MRRLLSPAKPGLLDTTSAARPIYSISWMQYIILRARAVVNRLLMMPPPTLLRTVPWAPLGSSIERPNVMERPQGRLRKSNPSCGRGREAAVCSTFGSLSLDLASWL